MQARSASHDWLTLTAAEPSKSQVRRTQAIGQRLVSGLHVDAGDILDDLRHVKKHDQREHLPESCESGEICPLRQGRQHDHDVRGKFSVVCGKRVQERAAERQAHGLTGNIAVRDYLEEYGYYDDYYNGADIGGGVRAYMFTAWEKM